jgi:8-oxo-dGTP pyrophosphatase MutT (NUDIX family)
VPLGEVGGLGDARGVSAWTSALVGILTVVPSYFRDPEAPAPNVPRRVGVVALIERGDSVLVQRRADDGAWDFLGGRLDEHETVLDALRREVAEESGLEVAEAALFGVFSDPTRIIEYPDGNICRLLSLAFEVQVKPGMEPVRSEESLELRFVGHEELAELEVWPSVRPIRDAFLATPDVVLVE